MKALPLLLIAAVAVLQACSAGPVIKRPPRPILPVSKPPRPAPAAGGKPPKPVASPKPPISNRPPSSVIRRPPGKAPPPNGVPTDPNSQNTFKLGGFNNDRQAANTAMDRILANSGAAWAAYKAAFDLQFSQAEDSQRLQTFLAKVRKVKELNSLTGATWTAGLNDMAHLNSTEFRIRLGALWEGSKIIPTQNNTGQEPAVDSKPPRQFLTGPEGENRFQAGGPGGGRHRRLMASPTSLDWSSSGKVSPVRNQGDCGSCWAFGPLAAIESLYRIKRGQEPNLSEEQLVDCADGWKGYANWGCGGGFASEALRYAKNNPVAHESYYRYDDNDSSSCEGSKIDDAVDDDEAADADGGDAIDDWVTVDSKDYQALVDSVVINPTVICFKVVDDFESYDSGIYDNSDCGSWTNHVMLATGYSTSSSYWIIKNSWGTSWGESGFARVKMYKSSGSKGVCGMYQYSYRPTL